MKILLDECVTKRLKPHLPQHDVATVTEKGWSGLKNGQLMAAASGEGFDILLTIDKNLQHQQNIGKYPLIVVILNSPSSKLEMLVTFLPSFEKQVPAFTKGNAYLVEI
jgi:predicted nuclease of predicted toxin-antitoxin system